MSKLEEKIETYKEALGKIPVTGGVIDENLLAAIAKSLGPSIHLKDASLVSCTDQAEMDRVKKNFLIGKLGLEDGPELDSALQTVCKEYNSTHKHRVVFYYLLVKNLRKESLMN